MLAVPIGAGLPAPVATGNCDAAVATRTMGTAQRGIIRVLMSAAFDPVGCLPPIATLDVELTALESVELPGWLGSTLHGALGGAMRAQTCSAECAERHKVQAGRCPYSRLFSTPPSREGLPTWVSASASPPLALRPPAPASPRIAKRGDPLTFGIVLFGERAIDDTGYVLAALERMAAFGLGKGRGGLALERVRSSGTTIWESRRITSMPVLATAPTVDADVPVTIRTVTPVRVMRDGEICAPRFEDLVAAAARRVVVLNAYYGGGELLDFRLNSLRDAAAQHRAYVHGTWEPFRTMRWSSRQRRKHAMEGYLGRLEVSSLGPFAGWIRAAALTGVGKATAFGFGQLAIREG